MVFKQGKVPANARMDIDYTKGKPIIKFNYPFKDSYKQALKEHSIGIHSIIILLIVFTLFYSPYIYTGDSDYPSNCSVELTGYSSKSSKNINYTINGKESNYSYNNSFSKVSGAEFICDTGNYSVYFDTAKSLLEKEHFAGRTLKYSPLVSLLLVFTWLSLMIFIFWILNRLVTKKLLKSKRYKNWFPEAQARGVLFRKKIKLYRKFNSKDVLDNVIIIPRFSNVELTYNTKGDFSKYLTKIKIREYKKQNINLKSNKKSKIESDNYKWYAVFYFSEKPKTGYLEVFYQ